MDARHRFCPQMFQLRQPWSQYDIFEKWTHRCLDCKIWGENVCRAFGCVAVLAGVLLFKRKSTVRHPDSGLQKKIELRLFEWNAAARTLSAPAAARPMTLTLAHIDTGFKSNARRKWIFWSPWLVQRRWQSSRRYWSFNVGFYVLSSLFAWSPHLPSLHPPVDLTSSSSTIVQSRVQSWQNTSILACNHVSSVPRYG